MHWVITGLFLILVPLAFNLAFFQLQRTFDYPDILRRPTDEILRRFRDGGAALRRIWYAFALSAGLFIPLPVLVAEWFAPTPPWYLSIGTAFGVIAGVVQVIGLLRWSFVVPSLAERYTAVDATPAVRVAAAVVFEAIHRFVGVAIGEHLGYVFTSLWTLLLAFAILQTGLFHPLIGWIGVVAAIGVFIGVFEETGFKPAGMINALSYILWSVWLVVLGFASFL